jgi:hypothetical protein
MTKIAGSGSISQRHGSADSDPDPHHNVMDLEHCLIVKFTEIVNGAFSVLIFN